MLTEEICATSGWRRLVSHRGMLERVRPVGLVVEYRARKVILCYWSSHRDTWGTLNQARRRRAVRTGVLCRGLRSA